MYIQFVIFPIRIPPVHQVLRWNLSGQGVILTGIGMFRTMSQCTKGNQHERRIYERIDDIDRPREGANRDQQSRHVTLGFCLGLRFPWHAH